MNENHFEGKKGVIGIVGAGNFTKMTMLPALKKSNAHIKLIASSGILNGRWLKNIQFQGQPLIIKKF